MSVPSFDLRGKVVLITGAVLYLASPASDFTTGSTFVIDGGQLAGGSYSIL